MDSNQIYFFLVACLIELTSGQEPYNITYFDSGPGLYYEKIGNASIYLQDFNIITFYDINKYFFGYNEVIKYTNAVNNICESRRSKDCELFVQLLNKTLDNLEYKDRLIHEILGIPKILPTRKKRFWGFATAVATGIFGLISGGSEESGVSDEIRRYREEVDYVKTMLSRQMYIYENFQKEVNARFNNISVLIDDLLNNIANIQNRLEIFEVKFALQMLVQETNILIQTFSTEQSDLLDCLMLAQQGILHPIIMSPSMLKEKLLEAKRFLTHDIILAESLQNAADHAHMMYNMIKPTIYLDDNTVIFDFDIPLIIESYYDIYKLTSAPISIGGNVYAYVFPERPYLFVEKRNERHFFLDTYEFDKCKMFGEKQYLCKRTKPLRTKKLTCEHTLTYDDNTMPKNCDIRLIKIDETLIIELEREESWLFIAPEAENIHFYCNKRLHRATIKGTGIIDVEPGCLHTETDKIILRDFSTNNLNLSQYFEIFRPKGDLRKYLKDIDVTYLSSTMNLNVLSRMETAKLKEIGTSLSALRVQNQIYGNVNTQIHNGILYGLIIVCCILSGIVAYILVSFRETLGYAKR